MVKKELLIIANYSEESVISLEELCEICGIQVAMVHELVSHAVVKPQGVRPEQWQFDLIQLHRLQTALRLQRDLEINLAGAALVLDLMEELERLRAHANLLEKHLMGGR